jgi:hypothetical protein
MTLISEPSDSADSIPATRRQRWLKPVLLCLAGTLFVTLAGLNGAGSGIPNSDDLVRIVQVRDLLAGQSWFDLMQYRLGLDDGTLMHWSRLVDAPIAAIVAIVSAISGSREAGEAVAGILWPAITVFVAMAGLMMACWRTRRPEARLSVAVIGAIAIWTIGVFAPGSLDHHNIQVALSIWMIALMLPGAAPVASAVGAGAFCVIMLAIGMEVLPYVAVAGLLVAAGFAAGPVRAERARGFGLAVAAATVLIFAGTVAPALYRSTACDAFSSFHLVAGSIAGLGLAAVSFAPRSFALRFMCMGGLGAAVFAAVYLLFPQCLENPLASLDPRLRTFWLEGVVETRSLADLWVSDPFAVFGLYGLPFVALAVTLRALATVRRERLLETILFLAFLVMGIAITMWQQRGFTFAAAFAILPLGSWIADLRAAMPERRQLGDSLKLAGAWLVSINLVWWMTGAQAASLFAEAPTLQEQVAAASPRDYCYTQDLYVPLEAEPRGVVLGATDLGASILLYTGHRAVAGPYHRNTAGNLLLIDAMLAQPETARMLLRRNGVTHVADCIAAADAADFIAASPGGLQASLRSSRVPAWLEPVRETLGTPMILYRVIP